MHEEPSLPPDPIEKKSKIHPGPLHNKLLLEWETPEFVHHPKGKTWYLIAGTVILGLVGYALYTDSATMAIVFIVLAGVYYITHNRPPRIIDVKITDLGIAVGERYYPYNMINSFWIDYHPPFVQTLNLKLGDKTSAKIVVQLNQQNPVEVRKMVAKEIPEIEGGQESTLDILIRLLRL